MMLFDISSAFHMVTHRTAKLNKSGVWVDLKEYHKEFYKGLMWVLDTHQKMFKDYGEVVVCTDNRNQPSWRVEAYPMYKSQRRALKESQTLFDYKDAYYMFDNFLQAMELTGCTMVGVPRAEADDIILELGFMAASKGEEVMILSPDKDFIQLQSNPLVQQYSWFTKKLITPGDKGSMDLWLLEHVCLGDAADCVPKITDFQEFNPGVKEYLEGKGIYDTPYEFSNRKYDYEEFRKFGGPFKIQPFGPVKLKKLLEAHGSLDAMLESSEHLKKSYDRNKMLVMRSGIPEDIKLAIRSEYQRARGAKAVNIEVFCDALGLGMADLPDFMKTNLTTTGLDSLFEVW